MSGLLWAYLGRAVADGGAQIVQGMQRDDAELERQRQAFELQAQRQADRLELQRERQDFQREMAAQRGTGGGGSRAPVPDETLAASLGLTLPEVRQAKAFTREGPSALDHKFVTLDDEHGEMEGSVPADPHLQRVARQRAKVFAELQMLDSQGKDAKGIAEARQTTRQMSLADAVLSGQASASDVSSAIAASEGKDRFTTSNGIVLDKFSGQARNLERPQAPERERAPEGFRFNADRTLAPIPGGPADLKRQDAMHSEQKGMAGAVDGLSRLKDAVQLLRQHPGLDGIVGAQGALPNYWGSKAANAATILHSLQSEIGLDTLSALRQASESGAGLGAISDREMTILQNSIASLDTKQSKEQFLQQLDRIDKFATDGQQRMKQAFQAKWGAKDAQQAPQQAPQAGQQSPGTEIPEMVRQKVTETGLPAALSEAAYRALPSGSLYVAPDGAVRRKR